MMLFRRFVEHDSSLISDANRTKLSRFAVRMTWEMAL